MTSADVAPDAGRPVLAIDLGGTQIRAGYVTPQLEVKLRRAVETRDEEGVQAVVQRIADLAGEVVDAARAAGLESPVGAGISSPGPIDPWRGLVVATPNLAGWRDVPLADAIEEALGIPTFLERDTNVAVLAEWRYGAGRGMSNVIYATVSTGIGGGLVLDGRPLYGIDGTAGEIGHITVELDGPLCGDGQQGHAEAIGSGTGIAHAGREALARGEAPGLAALVGGDRDAVSAADVAQAADAGDAASGAIMDRAYEAVGALCASLVNVLNPEVIVLGGSIADHRPQLHQRVREAIDRRAFPIPARRVRVTRAHFGDDVSLIGALVFVNERLEDPAYRRGSRGAGVEEGA
jgi:glucokinase